MAAQVVVAELSIKAIVSWFFSLADLGRIQLLEKFLTYLSNISSSGVNLLKNNVEPEKQSICVSLMISFETSLSLRLKIS
jgi:hypothetical protein